MLRVLLLLTACVPALRAFPDGAPVEACIRGMQPNHSGARGRSHQHAPFAVLKHTTHGLVTVTIKLTGNSAIKGFMVQARDPLTGKAALHQGAWLPIKNVKGLPECAAVTHADRGQKTEVSVTWEGRPDLAFYTTIVESYSSFWVDVEAVEQGGLGGPTGFGGGPSSFSSGFGPIGFTGAKGPKGPHLGRAPSGHSGPSGLGGVPHSGPIGIGFSNNFHPFSGKKK